MKSSPQITRRRAIVVRTCAGCGRRDARSSLERFGLASDGALLWRDRGGRGAYLHRDAACARKFLGNKKAIRGIRSGAGRETREALLAAAPFLQLEGQRER